MFLPVSTYGTSALFFYCGPFAVVIWVRNGHAQRDRNIRANQFGDDLCVVVTRFINNVSLVLLFRKIQSIQTHLLFVAYILKTS